MPLPFSSSLCYVVTMFCPEFPRANSFLSRIVNLVDNTTLADFSIIVKREGSVSSDCESPPFENNLTEFGAVSDLANITVGRLVVQC